MNVLSELKSLINSLSVPVETGIFKSKAPDTYIVLVPISDTYPLHSDDYPQVDYQECRITLYSKSNYIKLKNRIIKILLTNFFYITERKYNGYDTDAGYHQFTIDVAKNYDMEEDI